MKKTITVIFLMMMSLSYAQVTNEGKPESWKVNRIKNVDAHVMPKFDLSKLRAEDVVNDKNKSKPWRYGYEFLVDHNLENSGSWHTMPNGDRIWRIRYVSDGAQTMNFLFSDFYMPEGGKVYLYNNNRTDLLGAYDAAQNNQKRELGTWLVTGSDIWIEYYEPARVAGKGRLEIFKVVHGYRSLSSYHKDPDDGINFSGDCNYDVNCFMDNIEGFKEINKKAVGLIVVSNSAFCTGALVNNTSNDGTPYFLTADHCAEGEDIGQWAFRFNWISTNPVCTGPEPSTSNVPNYYQTVSGAELKARNAGSDFCLVELTSDIPDSWDIVWAGWDRSDIPATSTFGIHHPAGDIMKACHDFDSPGMDNQFGAMWVVNDWDLGVTQSGSSGSPLFDENGRIVGQLLGGTSFCDGLTDNGGMDFYGRFGVSWDQGATSSARLRDWLDPEDTGAVTLNHYPVQQVYAVNARVYVPQLAIEECSTSFQPVIKLVNKGSQNLTSAQITYALNSAEPVVINWTGNLAFNETADIQLPVLTGVSGENNIVVNALQPNGVADEDISDNSTSTDFIIAVFPVDNIVLVLMTDFFGEDTSWTLKDGDGTVLYDGDGYGQFEMVSEVFELTEAGCYIFEINDESGDGICCDSGGGRYRLETMDGVVFREGGAFSFSEQVTFRLTDVMSAADNLLKETVKIFPNPSAGIFNVVSEIPLEYSLSNTLGQFIAGGTINQAGKIDINSSASGIYMLTVKDPSSGRSANYKLVKK